MKTNESLISKILNFAGTEFEKCNIHINNLSYNPLVYNLKTPFGIYIAVDFQERMPNSDEAYKKIASPEEFFKRFPESLLYEEYHGNA
jgi:hypothetical protein